MEGPNIALMALAMQTADMPAHDRAIRRAALEEALRAVCFGCRKGWPVSRVEGVEPPVWVHAGQVGDWQQRTDCNSSIRALIDKEPKP